MVHDNIPRVKSRFFKNCRINLFTKNYLPRRILQTQNGVKIPNAMAPARLIYRDRMDEENLLVRKIFYFTFGRALQDPFDIAL